MHAIEKNASESGELFPIRVSIEKARELLAMHGRPILVLPNAWDAASARVVEAAGARAVATSSAAVAAALGYPDGERLPRELMLEAVRRIAAAVAVPVSADIEAGYGRSPEELAATTRGVLAAGAVGVNLEDGTGDGAAPLRPLAEQVLRIRAVREAAAAAGVPLVINARVDVFLAQAGPPENRFAETVRRSSAYRAAGADCLFVPGVSDAGLIARLVREAGGPLSLLAGRATPPATELESLGVVRLSAGSGLMRAALGYTRDAARELLTEGTHTRLDTDRHETCTNPEREKVEGRSMVRGVCMRLLAAVALAAASAAPGPAAEPLPDLPGNAAGESAAAGPGGLLRVPQDAPTLVQALSRVADGGVIELAAATYAAPASGFKVSNARKSFTIRAASGAVVVLDGGGQNPVFVLRNSARSRGGLVIFENLIFRHGGGGSPVDAAGVTIDAAEARFTGCSFENNASAAGADGGGAKVRNGSDAAFIGCSFSGNSSPLAGGAMAVDLSNVEVLGGSFVDNRVNLPPYDPSSHGGAINVIDGTLYVADALFQGNQAGWVAGAIFALGTPTSTPATPHALVSIIRSTFQANVIAPQPCCPPPAVPTGGAIHVEDQASLIVQDSRFVDNQAQFGGAINGYRALVDVSGSTFQGNGGAITGAYQSVGGAICALTNGATAGGQLPRPAAVTVTGSLLQGDHRGSGPVANAGGCILAQGDEQDLYGQGGVPRGGSLGSTRAPVAVTGSVFDHCDVQASPSTGGGTGGAINGALVALTLADSLVLESNAAGNGSGSGGGGIFLGSESAANISRTTFAGNAAGTWGGAIFGGGSDVEISGSRFIANQVSPGIPQPVNSSRGAALYFIPTLGGQPHAGPGDASGVVAGSLFSQGLGLPVWDVDFGGPSPVNTVQYNGNAFFDTAFGDRVYVDTYADPGRNGFNVAGLDSLVISRAGGPTTVKSALPNQALFAAPAAGSLKAVPPSGSPSARSAPFLAYAWSGNFATLNGAALPQHQGVIEGAAPGSYSLVVDGAAVDAATIAAPQCTADPVLCLSSDRFHVQVQWELPTGERGEGHPVALSGDTGYFWFFDPANVELIVKVLDGRPLNGRFWVFYGALSNVRYTLIVTDTVTGAVRAYVNPQGQLASVADTSAFLGTGNAPPVPPVVPPQPPPPGACAAKPGDLCLGSRFRVRVAWRTSTGSGIGTAVPLSGDTGYFWFFSPSNVELVLKILDGRSINGRFWVFYGALSNVGYTITVTDTQTGRAKTYVNPPGTMASVADTSALPGP